MFWCLIGFHLKYPSLYFHIFDLLRSNFRNTKIGSNQVSNFRFFCAFWFHSEVPFALDDFLAIIDLRTQSRLKPKIQKWVILISIFFCLFRRPRTRVHSCSSMLQTTRFVLTREGRHTTKFLNPSHNFLIRANFKYFFLSIFILACENKITFEID